MHPTTVDLIHLIAADMLAGCPHSDGPDLDDDGEPSCAECREQLAEDAAAYRAYTYH